MSQVPITLMVFVYNEAARIRPVLEQALQWADEIIVLEKGSTDGTLEIIRSYGDRVRIQPLPFCPRGHDEVTLLPTYATHEWIYISTCSEIPTRGVIEACRNLLDSEGDRIDLVYVPRRMYSFGIHFAANEWGVCHYPFLIHRSRTIITNTIHDNFHAADPARTRRIPYSEECCVHHFTYPTALSFWNASAQYFEVEAQNAQAAPDKAVRQCFKNIERLSERLLVEGENWIPFYCSRASYELGKALFIWEQSRGGAPIAPQLYQHRVEELLHREWKGPVPQTAVPAEVRPALEQAIPLGPLKPLFGAVAAFPYQLMKLTLAARRLLGRK